MPERSWQLLAVVIASSVGGYLGARLRRRSQRSLHGDGVFDASIRSAGNSVAGSSRAWGRSSGAVVHPDGGLRWRGMTLFAGRVEAQQRRRPQPGEWFWLNPWTRVWTLTLADGARVEVAVQPGDEHRLLSWLTSGA